jgi:hypothetical protein
LRFLRTTHIKAQDEDGSMVLEASLIMPLFIAVLIAIASILSVAIADIALYAGVSETTKQVAAHMYPVQEITEHALESERGRQIAEWVERIRAAKQRVDSLAVEADQHAFMIPNSFLELIHSYQQYSEQADLMVEEQKLRMLAWIFEPIVAANTDLRIWHKGRARIVHVDFPDLVTREHPYFGIEAEYTIKLPIPFVNRSVTVRHKAYERIWVGQ